MSNSYNIQKLERELAQISDSLIIMRRNFHSLNARFERFQRFFNSSRQGFSIPTRTEIDGPVRYRSRNFTGVTQLISIPEDFETTFDNLSDIESEVSSIDSGVLLDELDDVPPLTTSTNSVISKSPTSSPTLSTRGRTRYLDLNAQIRENSSVPSEESINILIEDYF